MNYGIMITGKWIQNDRLKIKDYGLTAMTIGLRIQCDGLITGLMIEGEWINEWIKDYGLRINDSGL